jgi:hypothetical protein
MITPAGPIGVVDSLISIVPLLDPFPTFVTTAEYMSQSWEFFSQRGVSAFRKLVGVASALTRQTACGATLATAPSTSGPHTQHVPTATARNSLSPL